MTPAERLLSERSPAGHWVGELSSSALSTATAVMALHLAGGRERLVAGGLDWLERTQNPDGGWGDTVRSISNISTTALCWAAFTLCGRPCDRARAWMAHESGSLEPARLATAIASRYGSDQTFSVPILTVLAVAGIVPWQLVPQLPFELAACPQKWFRWLQLPVVSYALPALIAIGHVRWRKGRQLNPLKAATASRTLNVLESIQPVNGGFLEATPLTSFVSISLLAAGYTSHEVVRKGIGFLEASVRQDGSWPIDTNLATWVTTLSVNALGEKLPAADRGRIREWLLGQQYRVRHPYTGAPPGGWAWTDLPGGVPDADDTSGALVALRHLGNLDNQVREAASMGITWLLDLQNRDGGMPTFCRGWGKLPFDRSSQDITAHALQAFAAWEAELPALQARILAGRKSALAYLEHVQRDDGAWIPLWFGNQFQANDENPVYGTARVLQGVPRSEAMWDRGATWLLGAQNADGGWGGDKGLASSIEETGLALSALAGTDPAALARGEAWLQTAIGDGAYTPSPIGFYFARLWYFERLYPIIFSVR
jgi:squalene-hopene/tetraprenyl-beta-curcumene cyclase